ncbi:MAG: VWA domain-containing protein [Candidatus Aminicenantes bacterium]|nr:VWA domain-containing protein [Candidatus Aminicenantes bacterium]
MKKIHIFLILLFIPIFISAQEQHEVSVIEVEVPVRVTNGSIFIDNLTINDFELYENGQLQKIRSLYLIKEAVLQKNESPSWTSPSTERQFFMLFQMQDFIPRLNEVIDLLFNEVLQEKDTLTIMTPLKRYTLSNQALQTKSKEVLAEELKALIRKDTMVGSSDYNSLLRELKRLVTSISSSNPMAGIEHDSTSGQFGIEILLNRYKQTLEKMDELRMVDEKKILTLAQQLKRISGQKIVFFFYQREFRPELEPRITNQIMSLYQDKSEITDLVQDLFQMYHRQSSIHLDRLKMAFADSSILFNFIFMNKDPENISGIKMNEQSEDVFSIFTEAAISTGGIVDNSQNPVAGFKNAVNASESYYLLTYAPANHQADGKFKEIKVMLKDKDYKVFHRDGYFSVEGKDKIQP